MSNRAVPPRPSSGSTGYLDIPPHTRNVFFVVALAGLVMAVIGSLLTGSSEIGADKLVHFAGYAVLGTLLVMGLPPKLWPLALLGAIASSGALELAQPAFGRVADWGDFSVNCIAVVAGGGMGLLGRLGWAYIRTEAVSAEVRKATVVFEDGATIFSQDDASDRFYIIRSGEVVLTREAGGSRTEVARAKAGEVIGEMGVLEGLPRSATATASGRCLLYGMTMTDLMATRADGQEHPGTIVARVLAQRLRAMNERSDAVAGSKG